MAGFEYSELQGNEPILKAVEYLRMLPEWKQKPAKLRTGHLEFSELLCRHLVNLYCTLEGKPITEKIELSDLLNPPLHDQETRVRLSNMDSSIDDYRRRLDAWHLEVSMAVRSLSFLIKQNQSDFDDPLGDIAHIVEKRAMHLVESIPFPDFQSTQSESL